VGYKNRSIGHINGQELAKIIPLTSDYYFVLIKTAKKGIISPKENISTRLCTVIF